MRSPRDVETAGDAVGALLQSRDGTVRELRQRHKQQAEAGSSHAGELIMRSPAAVERAQPAALAGSTALSRATSGNSIADGGAGFAATIRSSRPSRLGPDAAAVSDPRRAYTVNDTARLLSISRSTIYKLIKFNSLKSIRLCGRRLVTRASIEDLLAGDQ